MKSYIIILLVMGFCQHSGAQEGNPFFSKADSFFRENVLLGCLDYSELRKKPKKIDELVGLIEKFPFEKCGEASQKAFLLNAYNILVIHSILSADNDITSVKQLPGFFSSKRHKVAQQKVSLDELEKEWIFGAYDDPRLHLCLICGAQSCPKLPTFAFTPEHISSEILTQCRTSLNDDHFIRLVKDTLLLNPVFRWYEQEGRFSKDSILTFINHFRIQEIPEGIPISYYSYDWSLNDIQFKESTYHQPKRNAAQLFAPSRLLRKGQWDIKLFNNLYTETLFANSEGRVMTIPRNTFFSSQLEVFTGIDKQGILNVGMITQFRSTVISRINMSGMLLSPNALEALLFRNDNFQRRSAWATIAPVIKWAPFSKVGGLSVLSAFHIPLVSEAESPIFLTFNSYIWDNRVLYDVLIGPEERWQLYGELGFQYTFGERSEGFANNSLFLPLTLVTSYFPNRKLTLYALVQHGERIGQGAQNYSQAGLGIKWQWSQRLQLEGLFSQFLRGKSSGLGSSYNIGLRYLYL